MKLSGFYGEDPPPLGRPLPIHVSPFQIEDGGRPPDMEVESAVRQIKQKNTEDILISGSKTFQWLLWKA